MRHRLIQLAQSPSRVGQRQVRIRVIGRQRHRIRRPLIRPAEVAIILVVRCDLQVFRLALIGRLMKINPLLCPRRPPSLRSLRRRIRIGIIPQRPRRRLALRRTAAAPPRPNCWSYSPNSPNPSAVHSPQRRLPARANHLLPETETLTRPHPQSSPPAELAGAFACPPGAVCPSTAGAAVSPGNGKTLRWVRTSSRRSLSLPRRLPIRRRRLRIRRLVIGGRLAVRPEHRLAALIGKRASTLCARRRRPPASTQPRRSPTPISSRHASNAYLY